MQSVYEAVGGQSWFDALVDRFYARVEDEPVLRRLYPDDLAPGKQALANFLAQYWGGPTKYSDEKGHPRLRMRHAGFAIGDTERAAWLGAMRAAVRDAGASADVEAAMLEYFEMAAAAMVNRPGPVRHGGRA